MSEATAVVVRDMDYFMEHPEEFSSLTDEQRATVYDTGTLQGDTAVTAAAANAATADAGGTSGTPAAGSETEQATANTGGTTVAAEVAAKDGQHSIPFAELEQARAQAAEWQRIAQEQAETLKRLAANMGQPGDTTAGQSGDTQSGEGEPEKPVDVLKDLSRQRLEATLEADEEKVAEIDGKIFAELMSRAKAEIRAELQAEREADGQQVEVQNLMRATAAEVYKVYPFLDAQNSERNEAAIKDVIEWRDHLIGKGQEPVEALKAAVGKFGPLYQGRTAAAPAADDAAGRAAAAIAKARAGAPTTMSDIPAGTAAHHDEAEAMRNMSGQDLLFRFAGKTPEQIEAAISRLV